MTIGTAVLCDTKELWALLNTRGVLLDEAVEHIQYLEGLVSALKDEANEYQTKIKDLEYCQNLIESRSADDWEDENSADMVSRS